MRKTIAERELSDARKAVQKAHSRLLKAIYRATPKDLPQNSKLPLSAREIQQLHRLEQQKAELEHALFELEVAKKPSHSTRRKGVSI